MDEDLNSTRAHAEQGQTRQQEICLSNGDIIWDVQRDTKQPHGKCAWPLAVAIKRVFPLRHLALALCAHDIFE